MPRLTMQYTVDIDEVENEVARLLSKANITLKEISEEFRFRGKRYVIR